MLRVPARPPLARFWAISAYDPTTRSLLDVGGSANTSVGSLDDPAVNDDGTVDVHFGPDAPAGQEANWIPTAAGKGFFLVFRFYGPTESYIVQTWVLNDLDLVD